jgi:hypothetical protein
MANGKQGHLDSPKIGLLLKKQVLHMTRSSNRIADWLTKQAILFWSSLSLLGDPHKQRRGGGGLKDIIDWDVKPRETRSSPFTPSLLP